MEQAAAIADLPERDASPPKPEDRGPRPLPEVEVHDVGIRLLGIPFFGIVIPNLTGLFAPVAPYGLAYWLGYVWFVLLSALLWQGNRFFLVAQRRHYDWFDHPWRKVCLLLFANVFWTAPVSIGMLVAWYRAVGAAPDWSVIRVVSLANVICVIFITHVYETVHLIQQREDDLLRLARLEQARTEAELSALKAQVDPHFLFNSLNTLVHVIPRDPERAVAFTERLAELYRYILASRQRDLVPLAEELAFADAYLDLLRLRFGDTVRREGEAPDADAWLAPPIGVQVLFENAVKHNAFDERAPLVLRIERDGDRLRVSHALRPRSSARASSRVGLRNLDERCRRVLGRPIDARAAAGRFVVDVPLLRTGA